ncbi:hypothetical protein BGZ72_003699, partial [Mortierella alpina]
MDLPRTTHERPNAPVSGSVSEVSDSQLQQGLDLIKKGDEYRDRMKDDVATPKACQRDLRPVWLPSWPAAPKEILFKAVQDKDDHNAILNNLP